MRIRPFLCAVAMLVSIATSGCTIGPRVETRWVILTPGLPARVMEHVRVQTTTLNGEEHAEQDIGGWVVMPPEHWELMVTLNGGGDVDAQD